MRLYFHTISLLRLNYSYILFGVADFSDIITEQYDYIANERIDKIMRKFNKELLKLVAENSNHELMFFVADRPCEYQWTSCEISHISLTAMALYSDEVWLDEEDYEDKLYDVLSDEYENDDKLKEAVDCKMAMVEFKDYICVYLS